jgi:hypothetical protein
MSELFCKNTDNVKSDFGASLRTMCAHNVHNQCMTHACLPESDAERTRHWNLQAVVRNRFGGDNEEVVAALAQATGQTVTLRTVQAWLVDQSKKSHRRAPDWVLKGLETFLQQPEQSAALEDRLERRRQQRWSRDASAGWAEVVRANHAVEFATREIEHDARDRERFRTAVGVTAGDLLFERFAALEMESSSMSAALGAVLEALDESTSIEELRAKVGESTRVQRHVKMYVRDARAAIEKGTDEFGSPDGMPTS